MKNNAIDPSDRTKQVVSSDQDYRDEDRWVAGDDSDFNTQEWEGGDNEQGGAIDLGLSRTQSVLDLINADLVEARQQEMEQRPPQVSKEKLKASNFPAEMLKIGTWERKSVHVGDLIGKIYYGKQKIVWEVLEGALKSKIEIQWTDISAITAVTSRNEREILEIQLRQPPLFFREMNPTPRKHTVWQHINDFTNGRASICRKHLIVCGSGTLEKHYCNLLQSDPRLFGLSRKPFPSQENPYFTPDVYLRTGHPCYVADVDPPVVHPQHQDFNLPHNSHLLGGISNPPLSACLKCSCPGIGFSHPNETAHNLSYPTQMAMPRESQHANNPVDTEPPLTVNLQTDLPGQDYYTQLTTMDETAVFGLLNSVTSFPSPPPEIPNPFFVEYESEGIPGLNIYGINEAVNYTGPTAWSAPQEANMTAVPGCKSHEFSDPTTLWLNSSEDSKDLDA